MQEKKIVIVSDSHGNIEKLQSVIDIEYPFEFIIHCGDGINDLFHANIPEGVKVISVAGNVDRYRYIDVEDVIFQEIFGRMFMVTHGDRYDVRNGNSELLSEAREHNADIILFGHTHVQYIDEKNPVVFNPGSLSTGLYGLMTAGNRFHFRHKILVQN